MIQFDMTELTDPSWHNRYGFTLSNLTYLTWQTHRVIINMIWHGPNCAIWITISLLASFNMILHDLTDPSYHNQYDFTWTKLSNLTNHVIIGTIHHELTRPDRLIISQSIWFHMTQLFNITNHAMIGTIHHDLNRPDRLVM